MIFALIGHTCTPNCPTHSVLFILCCESDFNLTNLSLLNISINVHDIRAHDILHIVYRISGLVCISSTLSISKILFCFDLIQLVGSWGIFIISLQFRITGRTQRMYEIFLSNFSLAASIHCHHIESTVK